MAVGDEQCPGRHRTTGKPTTELIDSRQVTDLFTGDVYLDAVEPHQVEESLAPAEVVGWQYGESAIRVGTVGGDRATALGGEFSQKLRGVGLQRLQVRDAADRLMVNGLAVRLEVACRLPNSVLGVAGLFVKNADRASVLGPGV